VRSGAGNNQWKLTTINGADAAVKARVSVDMANFTGMSTASDTFYYIGVALDNASTLRLDTLTPRCLTAPPANGGSHQGVYLSANLTVGGTRGYVEKMDMAKAISGAGFDVVYNTAAQKDAVIIRGIVSQRSNAGGSGPITAPVGMTGLVSGTGKSIGSV